MFGVPRDSGGASATADALLAFLLVPRMCGGALDVTRKIKNFPSASGSGIPRPQKGRGFLFNGARGHQRQENCCPAVFEKQGLRRTVRPNIQTGQTDKTAPPGTCPTDILPGGAISGSGSPAPLPRGNVQSGNPPDARENPMENGHRPPRGEPASASGLDYGTSVRIAPETNLMAQIWAGCPRKMLAPSAVPPFNPIPR